VNSNKPIGIFDSGLGGLSICRAVKGMLPDEDIIYFADTHYAPYGSKSKKTITERAESIIQFLIAKDCKLIIIACNTATVTTIKMLRLKYAIPIIGIEPGIKPASLNSKKGVIGVLATEQTLKSDSFHTLKAQYSSSVTINVQACPDFVNLVESTNHESSIAIDTAESYIRPLLAAGCDQIVLGCTHFSFLMSAIRLAVGNQAEIIDTAVPVAEEVKRKLQQLQISNQEKISGVAKFWTSGDVTMATPAVSQLWGQAVTLSYAQP